MKPLATHALSGLDLPATNQYEHKSRKQPVEAFTKWCELDILSEEIEKYDIVCTA
ncbi:hypothetical protein M7I_6087 [Glarea lozoyensis 74030]|uniref:Uncharacterized protein n=1 Tax=Glarea lozoyensis (strain ATCC 74030 / MF5533) TaxID=1104152 RepID=H0ETM2_GLAL7|nr:hypothetical protein M7I_6087 [Glarea lozoyensis 74030]